MNDKVKFRLKYNPIDMKRIDEICTYLLPTMGLVILLGVSCKKEEVSITPPIPPISVTDIEGNVYQTTKIGGQVWTTENLRVVKFNDGSPIPIVTDNTEWSKTTPSYCWFKNDAAMYKGTYGALYNWHAVNTGKLCPAEWHVASDAEWTTLITYLGGEAVAGGKLKEFGTSHWVSPNSGATNETKFTALPGAGHYYDGTWWDIGSFGNYWTSTGRKDGEVLPGGNVTDANFAIDINLHTTDAGIYRDTFRKGSGFSVRCIKD